jgi:hypothetical protein
MPVATLQISLAPSDYSHAQLLLAHQVRAWQGQYTELLITIDLHRSSGRFSTRWEEGRDKIVPLAQSIPGARVVLVDYGDAAQTRVANEFFGGAKIPTKDFRGGPFYSYFFALAEAQNNHVLHTDSDIFFGGGSATWLDEAILHMAAHPAVLVAAPLSGPPRLDGRLITLLARPDPTAAHAFFFDAMSTRVFLLNRARFKERIGMLQLRRPSLRNTAIALLERNPPRDLPEHLFTAEMAKRGMLRREFLGSGGGRWTLHPPFRCADFYEKLPSLIKQVEQETIPDEQRGCHDFNASMVDWSEAYAGLAKNRLWRRLIVKYNLHA